MWWMQIILASLQPDHEVFDPLYMPPNPYVQSRLPEPKVANIDNFYEASLIPQGVLSRMLKNSNKKNRM